MASSVMRRKSLSETGSSPRASRWELRTILRYLATLTPGTATGDWKAMKRAARGRAPGAGPGALVGIALGDVLAVEGDRAVRDLEAGVAQDRVGERRLPRAVGPHERV